MILQTEINAGMDETLPEMAVERAEIIVLIEKRAEIAQVFSDVVRRNRRIFPSFPGIGLVRHARARPQSSIANFPDHRFVHRIVDQFHFRCVHLRLERGHQFFGGRVRLFSGLPAELHQEPAVALR